MKRHQILLGLPLLAAGLLAGGCGAPRDGEDRPRTLTLAIADNVKTLDPALAFDTWSTSVVHALTRRLVDYDPDGSLIPDLADRWEVSADGREYRFHLREDARFADGSPIEARHFKAAIDRVRDPATASGGAAFYAGIRSLEAADARTLVIRLTRPDPTLPNLMAMTFAAPVLPGGPAGPPPGSGPYLLESHQEDVRVVLRRNPLDTRNPSGLEQLVLQLGVGQPLQMTRFRSGEVDLLAAIPAAEYARVTADPAQKDNVVQGVVNQTWYFGMNVTRYPWNDARIRRAALLALNRARHVQLAGAGQEANGILPPRVPGADPGRTLPARDVEAARRLVAQAGYPGGLPAQRKPVMWLAANELYQRHAQVIQADLAAAGIPVDLKPVTYSEYLTGYKSGADCWYGGWYPDFPDAGNFLEPVLHGKSISPGASSNASRYANPKVNALLDRARVTPLGSGREALYREAEEIILADVPWVPLYFEVETRYFRDGVTGVTVHPVWRQILTGIDRR